MSAAKIPARYKFSEQDYAKSLEISFRFFSDDERVSSAVTESELHFMALADEAHRVFCVTKRWPTMAELRKHMEQDQ